MNEYSQAEVDKQMRADMIEVSRMPYAQLIAVTNEELAEMPAYKAMWISVLRKASGDKPDLRAVEFVQEHLAGKAVQRLQSQTVSMTYQDVLRNIRQAEERFQAVTIKETQKLNWVDVL